MRKVAVLIASTILLAGCGAGAPTPNPALTPAPVPAGWTFTSWHNPDLEVALPSDWSGYDPTPTTRPEDLASLAPDQQVARRWGDQKITAGVVRFAGSGKIATPLGTVGHGSLWIIVESGDASLDAFADRSMREARALGLAPTRTTVVLPAGVAALLSYSGQFGLWPKFVERDYLYRLPDGRSLTLMIAGLDTAATDAVVDDFAARVIATLRPTS